MSKQRWSWARSEIATLDPKSDAQRMAHLSFEVRFGTPIFLHALFNVAFAYNMGIPDTARILYREGRGTIMRRTRKRNFDSMIFFGELYRHGDSPEGVAICECLNRIHANFPIHNDLSLYTLATLGSTPIPRTLQRRPIMVERSVHVEAKEVQPGVQAGGGPARTSA